VIMKAKIWIVEWWIDDRWEATVGAALNREDARLECKRWRENDPSDRFRVRLYVPAKREKDRT